MKYTMKYIMKLGILMGCLALQSNAQAVNSPYVNNPSYAKTMRFNGLTWHYLGATDRDVAFAGEGVRNYVDGYPVISVMYVGALNAYGNPVWAGKRFIKLKVNCRNLTGAVIADAVTNSNGSIVKDEDYPPSKRNNWERLNNYFSATSLLRYSHACSAKNGNLNALPKVR